MTSEELDMLHALTQKFVSENPGKRVLVTDLPEKDVNDLCWTESATKVWWCELDVYLEIVDQ